MKKEWFEPGPDGVSPFEREYRNHSVTPVGYRISAAFRALLAESEAVELGIGDWVRLEAYSINSMPDWVGKEARIVDFDPESCDGYVRLRADGIACEFGWKHTALTLVRRAGDVDKDDEIARLQSELHARNDEIVGLRAEVEGLKERIRHRRDFESQRDLEYAHWQNIEVPDIQERMQDAERERDAARAEVERCNRSIVRLTAHRDRFWQQRDALQARIDAGVRVWSIDSKDWHVERCLADNHSATLLIDHIADPGKMVDERKGKADRRMTHAFHYYKPSRRKYIGHTQYQSNTVEWARYNDRRKTPGTRADRGQA